MVFFYRYAKHRRNVHIEYNRRGCAYIKGTIGGREYSTDSTGLVLSYHNLSDSDIEQLRYLTNLTYLDLQGNQISDIRSLQGLTNLTVLDLTSNQISDISALSNLISLTYLDLRDNQITDFSVLDGLLNLSYLEISEPRPRLTGPSPPPQASWTQPSG